MTMRPAVYLAILGVLCGSACRSTSNASSTSVLDTASGTIRGRVRLMGQPPENAVIRMRADLMCDKANGGQRVVQETVVAAPDGGLANVFIQLQGEFPGRPVPAEPVTIDQRGCIYTPRVVGIRLGQPLRVQNSDPGLHNVHGVSEREGFNIGQPMAGMVNTFQLKHEGMLRLQCDVNGWMVAFVGLVSHPYFAVPGTAGTYEI